MRTDDDDLGGERPSGDDDFQVRAVDPRGHVTLREHIVALLGPLACDIVLRRDERVRPPDVTFADLSGEYADVTLQRSDVHAAPAARRLNSAFEPGRGDGIACSALRDAP